MSPYKSPFLNSLRSAAGKLSRHISPRTIGTAAIIRFILCLSICFFCTFAPFLSSALPEKTVSAAGGNGFQSFDTQPFDPFRSLYPPVAKIIGQGELEKTRDTQSQSLFYGSGTYAAEVGEFGIVLTNWHVVSESTGPLIVKFSNFEDAKGTVIMADTVWDIAAIVIHRPPFLPLPISLEVPQIGDELWVAGFGRSPDLSGYRISSGPVLGYGRPNDPGAEVPIGGPDAKTALPCETIQIGTGIRYGDSGGPIINQYGELAGILWGSDGHLTMGTFCLRLQAFLTQAQFQLMHYRVGANEFFARAARNQIPVKKIAMPSVPAQGALRSSGIFPISSVPVYTAGTKLPASKNLPAFYKPASVTDIEGAKLSSPSKEFLRNQADYKNAHNGGYTLPPYPAIQSPTLIAQRKAIGRSHPEVYIDTRFAAAEQKDEPAAEIQETGASNVTFASTNSESGIKYKSVGNTDSRFNNASLETASPSPRIAAQAEGVGETEVSEEAEEKSSLPKKVPGFPQISLNNLQSIIAIVVVLFLFVNSLRLLSIASERKERGDKAK